MSKIVNSKSYATKLGQTAYCLPLTAY